MSIKRIKSGDLKGLIPKDAMFVLEYCKDNMPRRAAAASGHPADDAHKLLAKPEIGKAIDFVIQRRLDASDIDAEWLLMELVDNHMIAKQTGQIPASNTALGLIAKHKMVGAFAAEEIIITTDREITERIARGRARMNSDDTMRLVSRDGITIDHEPTPNDLFANIPLAKPGLF